jgi:hypothetical protein
VLAVVFVLANRSLPGVRLALMGALANLVVIVANGGLMPTHPAALERAGMTAMLAHLPDPTGTRLPRSKDVVLPIEQTRLWWLSDVLISPPLPRRTVMSPGDVLLAAGLATLAAQATRGVPAARQAGTAHRAQPTAALLIGAPRSWAPQP